MIWSLVKVIFFVSLAIALSFGLSYVLETPGGVRIAFGDQEVSLAPIGFIFALLLLLATFWILLKLSGLLVAVLRFTMGDETALTRYWGRKRERRGFDALADGMVSLAAGEGEKAMAQAAKAERLLNRPELTRLLSAQAAEQSGNGARALEYYKEMLQEDRTRFVGVQGILKQKLAEGDTDTALKLAEKAFALRPAHHGNLDTLFLLQSEAADWSGARTTLSAKLKAKALPRDVAKRRDAVLLLADAKVAYEDGDQTAARDAALQANKMAPTLVPAAVLAARILIEEGSKRPAAKILKAAWQSMPHPDLATAFAAVEPEESHEARRKRFDQLVNLQPAHRETKMLLTELALSEEDFPTARRAIGDLVEEMPTTRTLALMAAIERGSGSDEDVVRAILAKALSASRGDQWVCSVCGHAHVEWSPTCHNCSAFDTMEWKEPAESEAEPMDAVLSLIVGATPIASTKPDEPQDAPPIIIDAEVVDEDSV
ncbi:MAG: heme biosynthesis protein HemY [Rhodobacteraceae bacterium]|nr:heme biosynthesis protein HemY [Paracoccaceae bacterium]